MTEIKDSGERQQYASGMMREPTGERPRFELILTKAQPYDEQMLTRYAKHLAKGAVKYADRNWEEATGEEELERAKGGLLRHTMQLLAGETDEDHAAAVWFNTQEIEYIRWAQEQRRLVLEQLKDECTDRFVAAFDGSRSGAVGLFQFSTTEDWKVIADTLPKTPVPPEGGWAKKWIEECDSEDSLRRMLNDWHNRPAMQMARAAEDATRAVPGTLTPARIRRIGSAGLARVDEWAQLAGVEILDYDGFRDVDTYALLTRKEFLERVAACTVKHDPDALEWGAAISKAIDDAYNSPESALDPADDKQ